MCRNLINENMAEITHCTSQINRMLNFLYSNKPAMLVNVAIFDKFITMIAKRGIFIPNEHIWDFTLFIADTEFAMKLFWITFEVDEQKRFVNDLISKSQFCLMWEENFTVYMPIGKFDIVEKFIAKHCLSEWISKIITDRSRKCSRFDLKMVEFHQEVPRPDINDLNIFNGPSDNYFIQPEISFFVKSAFNYLSPEFLQYLDRPYYNPDTITQVLLLLDYHRQRTKKGFEVFNILDLIAMKMAIDDPRLEYENCEFHKLIGKTLRQMITDQTYIRENMFDLVAYRTDKGIFHLRPELYHYLIHNFQLYFDKIMMDHRARMTIKLSTINRIEDVQKKIFILRDLYVDGSDVSIRNADRLFLLLGGIKSGKKLTIHLDTNHHWLYAKNKITKYTVDENSNIHIIFTGNNKFHYVENFTNCLKFTLGAHSKFINQSFIEIPIVSPQVFQNAYMKQLTFSSQNLERRLLASLLKCNYDVLRMETCHLPNDPELVRLLENLERVRFIDVWHEEHTFLIFLNYVEGQLRPPGGLKRFRFKNKIRILPAYLALDQFIFFLNEQHSKIEVLELASNTVINIYDLMYKKRFDNRKDFDFYQ